MPVKRKFGMFGALLISSRAMAFPSQAETVARANGRCQLKENSYEAYNGYCTVKQKQNGGTTIFVVALENGNRFRFSGPSRQQLHVETPSGIKQNVLYEDQDNKGRFSWNDGRLTHQLAVKTDTVTNANAQFEDQHSNGSTGAEGQPMPGLQNLVGGDPGYVESRLTSSEYTYIQSSPRENGMDSFWKRGDNCVDVRNILNRYQSFTYANPSRCR